jgi:hypothetical protein
MQIILYKNREHEFCVNKRNENANDTTNNYGNVCWKKTIQLTSNKVL